ncbi:hypothetical protein [Nocardioides sp. KR10-350]|uniref:hypothetical protein n=1 Tax=Nocardioides cheoyonin TaxID=3156615 RepID=UPI0032B4F942
MTRIVGLGLLASAFAPMVAMLALLRIKQLGCVGWIVVALCIAAVLLLSLVLHAVSKIQTRTVSTTVVRRADDRVLAFTSNYVAPTVIAIFGREEVSTLAVSSALVALVAFIYVRAGLYHLNPTLAVVGFRLYEVTADNGTVTMLLTRERHIPQRGSIVCRYVGQDVAVQLRR